MFVIRLKRSMVGLLLLGAAMVALPALADKPADKNPQGERAPTRGPQNPEVRGVVRAVTKDKNSLTVAIPTRGREGPEEKTFSLAKDAEVLVDAGRGARLLLKEGKLTDLHEGTLVALTLSEDGKTVETIVAEGQTIMGVVKGVDAGKGTITLAMAPRGRGEGGEEKTISVDKHAEIALDDGRGRRFSVKEGKLADIPAGSLAAVKLSLDGKRVQAILATGAQVVGVIKAVDLPKHTITLEEPRGRGEAEEKTWTLAKDSDVLVDDGRGGREGFGRLGKPGDLRPGVVGNLKLSLDQKTVVLVRVSGPTIHGQLKAVDAGKRTVTVLVGAGRGSDGEEKTFPLARKAVILQDGRPVKLGDVKIKDNMQAGVHLSLDQKEAKSVHIQAREGSR